MKITRKQLKKLIKEELNEQFGGSQLTPQQEKVENMCFELADAIYDMGQSSPDMTDAYLQVLRAFQQAGVNLKNLTMLV